MKYTREHAKRSFAYNREILVKSNNSDEEVPDLDGILLGDLSTEQICRKQEIY